MKHIKKHSIEFNVPNTHWQQQLPVMVKNPISTVRKWKETRNCSYTKGESVRFCVRWIQKEIFFISLLCRVVCQSNNVGQSREKRRNKNHYLGEDKTPGAWIMRTLGSDWSVLNYAYLDLIGCQLESVMKKEVLKCCKMRGFVYVINGPWML